MKLSQFFLLFLCIGCTPKASFQRSGLSQEAKNTFESKITSLYNELGLASDFIIGIVDSTGLIYSYTIQGKTTVPHTRLMPTTPFYLGSHTKAMTGTLVQILEEEGLLKLDDPVTKYLPELTFNGKFDSHSITLRHLLSHTHGIQNPVLGLKTSYLGYSGGDEEVMQTLNTSSSFDSTRSFSYSNIGPIIAGLVVGKMLGKDWRRAMQEKLFKPLNMSHTSGFFSDYELQELLPTDIQRQPDGTITAHHFKNDQTMHAAGGTYSTLEDLANWTVFNLNQGRFNRKTIVTAQGMKNLLEPSAQQDVMYLMYKRHGYSTGWDLATYNGDTLLARFGGFVSSTFHLSFLPKQKLGMIAFTNENRANRLLHIGANLAYNLALQKPNWEEKFEEEKQQYIAALKKRAAPSQRTTPEIETSFNAALIGTYKNATNWPPVTIEQNNGQLIFRWGLLTGNVSQTETQGKELNLLVDFQVLTREFSFVLEDNNVRGFQTGSGTYVKQ